jgi:hypothetical protein
VHGDLWSGNIAVANGYVKFIDWGDAVWGAGGAAVSHFLVAEEMPADMVEHVWAAYGEGWGTAMSAEYRAACSVAGLITGLPVDMEIIRTGPAEIPLKWLVTGLEQLTVWLES